MSNRLGLVIVALAVLLTISASGGFSAGTIDRSTTISVVDHHDGLVSITPSDPEISINLSERNETNGVVITIGNRLAESGLDVVVSDGEAEFEDVDFELTTRSTSIGFGETADVMATTSCDRETRRDVTLSISAAGNDVLVETNIDVEIRCTM